MVKSIKELKLLLFEDKRIDVSEFNNCDFVEMMNIAQLYEKTNLNLLVKLIRREYLHE